MGTAACYLRQSVDKLGDELAISRQREDCLKLCEERGWTPVEYTDNDISATSGKRPAYEQMLADIRAGGIDAVVAWDLDRLHRRPIELEHFIDLADEKHLALATVGGDADLSTDSGRLFARIKGAVARAEVERKSARQKRAMRQKADEGRAWGPRAFGFTKDRDGTVQREARAIRRAYSTALAGGSLYSIAAQWNKANIATASGNTWTGRTVRQVLLNPRNAGLRAYNGEIVGKANWPAIVPEDVWRGVKDILTDQSRQQGATPRKHLLTGLALCGNCSHPLGSGVKRRTEGVVYVCKKCFKVSRSQEPIDAIAVGLAVGFLARADAVELLVDRSREDIGELRDSERATLELLDTLAADYYVDRKITASQFGTANDKLNDRLADVRGKMLDANRSRVFEGLVGVNDVRAVWERLGLERRRAVISSLFTITVNPVGRGQRRFSPEQLGIDWLTAQD